MKKFKYLVLSILVGLSLFLLGIKEVWASVKIEFGVDQSKRIIKLENGGENKINPLLAFLELGICSDKFEFSLLGGMSLTNLNSYLLFDQVPISIETNFSDHKAYAFGGKLSFHIFRVSFIKIGALVKGVYYSHYSDKPNEWKIDEFAEIVTNKELIDYIRLIGGLKFSYDFKSISFYLAPVYSDLLNGKLTIEQRTENLLEGEEVKSFKSKTKLGFLGGIELGKKFKLKGEFKLLSEKGFLVSVGYRF